MLQEEKLLAAALEEPAAFDSLQQADVEHDFSDKAKLLWKEIERFYRADPSATKVDRDIVVQRLERAYPKHAEMLCKVVRDLPQVSIPNIVGEVIELKKEVVRNKLSAALLANKEQDIEELLEDYNTYRRGELHEDTETAVIYNDHNITTLISDTDSGNRTKLLPAVLNEQLDGGLLPGHHVVVFAPTEMGKSLFGINAAYGFVKQGKRVLYIGNEDPMESIIMRFLCRLTNMTMQDIRANPAGCDQIAHERGYSNIIFAELTPGTPHEIRELIEEYKVDVLIIDQIRNLYISKEQNRVLQLEKSAQAARNLGKEYNLIVISLTQAADSATNKVILDRGDVDFSNVGIPGTADLMIGIGADSEMESNGYRMLSLVKNKVGGEKMPVRVHFDNKLSKVSS